MIELDLRSRQPIYEQLVEKLKSLIVTGVMKTDEQLPSVRQLAIQLTINPNTIQKSYRELEQQGFTYSLPGKGSFVAPISDHINNEKLRILREELKHLLSEALYLGMDHQQMLDLFDEVQATLSGAKTNA